MARRPVTGLLSQYAKNAGGASASGYWLKFFSASYGETTSPLTMYTRQSGGVGLAKCKLSTRGEPISDSGNNNSTFIPYINGDWDAYIFFTEADADANNTVNSIYLGTNIQPEPDFSTRAIVQFADVDGMINGDAIDGSSINYDALTNNGAWKPKVSTVVNNTTSKKGGAEYIIKTADQATADGDVIDGYVNHWLLGGNSYAAILLHNGEIFITQAGGLENSDSSASLSSIVAIADPVFDIYAQFDSGYTLSTKRKFTAINGGGMKPLSTGNFSTLTVTADGSHVEGLKIGTVDERSGNTGHGVVWNCDDGYLIENQINYGATRVYHGIRLLNANRNIVALNKFTSAPDNSGGTFTDQPGADIAAANDCSDNFVYKNVCNSGNCYGINFTSTLDNPVTRGNVIAENVIDGPLAYGIILYRDPSVGLGNFDHNHVINNTIRNVSGNVLDTLGVFQFGSGIYLQMCLETVCTGNTIDNVAQFTSGTTLPIGGITGTQCSATIADNIIRNSGVTGIYMSSGQINAQYPDQENSKIIIDNNTIEDTDNQAIWVNNGRRVLITDNVIINCSSTGVNMTSTNVSHHPRAKVTGNIISGATTGMNLSAAKYLEVTGNHFEHISAGFSIISGSKVLEGVIDKNCTLNASNGFQVNSAVRVGYYNMNTPMDSWQASTAYVQADWVVNGSNVYRCRTAGTSAGSGGPTGTGTEIADNTAEWDYVAPYYAGSYSLYAGSFGIYRTLDNSATPSVKNGKLFKTGGSTTITDFIDQHAGQIISIRSNHVVTITHGSGILLNGNVDFVMSGGDTLTLCCFDGNNWEEIGRMNR